ncbi:ion channel [Aquimonas voraii]|uniref:Ion channel n=1 Tax=Aquimonas voraii TaxID=265719 RepID=A0A1G6VG98_9GAMM|nr:ion channel [Aquimonas voraii]SDD52599.1 Ion channel [Aquimonas voraii]
MWGEYGDWGINALVVAATVLIVSLCVLLHYESLVWLSERLRRLSTQRRRKVLYGVYALLLLHVTEIWLFGLGLWLLMLVPGAGHLSGLDHAGLLDSVYLSAASFTTVGFGDLAPVGPIRFLVGTEALTGFVLITWSASFTFIEMETFWRSR